MKRKIKIFVLIIVLLLSTCMIAGYYLYQDPLYIIKPGIKIDNPEVTGDKDNDGLLNAYDIVEGARKEIENKTKYKSEYYVGGFPPPDEGVCTDVVWRAFMNAGFDLKYMMDEDIAKNISDYPGVNNSPDPNIDFRRVKNQYVFFKRNAMSLTIVIKPYNIDNLCQWQPGDIVVLKNSDHVAVISDKRRKDGVPLIIHNSSSHPKEENLLMKWYIQGRIIGHFRYPKNQ